MSNVDPTVPVQGKPTTESVRDNFSTIKTELEAFQSTSTTSDGAANVAYKHGGSTGTFTTNARASDVAEQLDVRAYHLANNLPDDYVTDGSVDYTTQIQAWLDHLDANGLVGIAEPGTYLASQLTINGSCALSLRGVTFKQVGSTSGHFVSVSGGNVSIIGLKIDGNKANQSATNRGLRFTADSVYKLQDVQVHSCKGVGCDVQGPVTDVTMIGCEFYSNDLEGFWTATATASNITAIGCKAYSNGSRGFFFNACDNVQVLGCTAYSNSADGFSSAGFGDNHRYVDCVAYSNTTDGFDWTVCTNVTYVNCEAYSNNTGFNPSKSSFQTSMIGCTSRNNTSNGVSVSGAVGFEAIGCKCYSNGGHGLSVVANTDSDTTGTHTGANNASVLTDAGNTWTTNQFVGWTIRNTTDGSSGTITANTADTITATLAGGTDNDWDTSDAYVIDVFSKRAKVIGGEFYENTQSGIEWDNVKAGGVQGAACYNNDSAAASTHRGILVSGATDGCVFANNECYDDQDTATQYRGIHIIETVANCLFIGNRCYGNANASLVNSSSGANTFTSNLIDGATSVQQLELDDGITAPTQKSGKAIIYVDTSDGDLKVRFSNGFTATIAADS